MITIIGIGALGSHVALLLRNEKERLKVVDFDRIETKNTQAQFHSVMSVGKNKAQALFQSFQGLFGVKVEFNSNRLTADNARVILEKSKLVIDCTDNIEARSIMSVFCRNATIPLLHGALSASGDFARVVWEEHFIADAEGGDVQATCVDGAHLPFHGAAAAYLAVEAQRFLKTGKKCSWQLTPSGVMRLA